jgi:CRP-like cAMP-binding protein
MVCRAGGRSFVMMQQERAAAQRASDPRATHPEDILARINGGPSSVKFRPKQIIYSQGDPAEFVYYVQAGALKASVVSSGGRQAVIVILTPGSFCGEECLAKREAHIATLTALGPCALMPIPKRTAVRALHEEPEFSRLLVTYLMKRGTRAQEDLADQLLNPTEKRLARRLLILASGSRAQLISPRINHETLAEMVGASRTHVSFFMKKFRQLGHIENCGADMRVSRSLQNVLDDSASRAEIEPAVDRWSPSEALSLRVPVDRRGDDDRHSRLR